MKSVPSLLFYPSFLWLSKSKYKKIRNKGIKVDNFVCTFYAKLLALNKLQAWYINPWTTNILHHSETSQLIWNANQLTGFCMMANIGR